VTGPTAPRVDVQFGDVRDSQLIVGDHNTIQTAKGTKVTVLQVGERPVPRLRAMPLGYRPSKQVEIVGREHELELAEAATAESPLELYAPDGAGKSALLKFVAQWAVKPSEGVLLAPLRRRSLDDIHAKLYSAFWECDVPFLPDPAEVASYLADREALLLLDDCGLDRDDLDVLLDSAPKCTVLIASTERTLWSRGSAEQLPGLDPADGVKLLERELGHPIGQDEHAAAELIVSRLAGHPQSLVETAALILDGKTSLTELRDNPSVLATRTDPALLSATQRRILEVLSALNGAAIGTEHVAALAEVPGAARELEDLEQRGWVKSASPRYRLVRTYPGKVDPGFDDRLLAHLAVWSSDAKPVAVAEESEAIEAALARGAAGEHWKWSLELAQASEGRLAVAGSWTSWRHVLESGLKAARALGDDAAEAHMLHQLGSLALCLGAHDAAVSQLEAALGIRERLGDHEGAELTRHNLGQLGGGAGPPQGDGGEGGGRGGPGRPHMGAILGGLGLLAAGVVAVVLATNGGGNSNSSNTSSPGSAPAAQTEKSQSTVPAVGKPPSIDIAQPQDGSTLDPSATVNADYACTASEGARVTSCKGPVEPGQPIDMTPGTHTFQVVATDDAQRTASSASTYTVKERPPPDTTPPTVQIRSPTSTRYSRGAKVIADFDCADEAGGSGIKSCTGTVPNGAPIDTSGDGTFTFTVTGVDNAGNSTPQSVTYTVFTPIR
jgi:hypothetical protein